jgi:hypothetical protein
MSDGIVRDHEKELTALQNQIDSYARLLEIEKARVDTIDSQNRRERAAAEIAYQKAIDILANRLADSSPVEDIGW